MGSGGDRQMGAMRKRMLFSRRAEEQTQWVVGMTHKCRGQRERVCQSVGQRADMNILRGSAQPKNCESLNQVFSKSLTENFFFNRCFTSLLVVWCLKSLK